MGAAAAEADRTLFVGNLETKVTEELLFELFHQVSGWDQPFPPCSARVGPGPVAGPAFGLAWLSSGLPPAGPGAWRSRLGVEGVSPC